jgi:hypothetical protein
MFKHNLHTQGAKIWTGLSWLMMRFNGELFEHVIVTAASMKRGEHADHLMGHSVSRVIPVKLIQEGS